MIWILIPIAFFAGFVVCGIFAVKRIIELEAQCERGPLCSMCETDTALTACRADNKALSEQVETLKRSRAQLLGHNARLMNGFLYPRKGSQT